MPDSEARGDGAAVAEKLAAAATWGDVERVKAVLRTCYVTRVAALPALAGAAEEGHVEVRPWIELWAFHLPTRARRVPGSVSLRACVLVFGMTMYRPLIDADTVHIPGVYLTISHPQTAVTGG